MTLSVASSAASYGKFIGNDLAGLSTLAVSSADTPGQPSVAPSWSWAPTSTGTGGRGAPAGLMAALAQFQFPNPDDRSASSSATGVAQDGGSGSRVALNDTGATPTVQAATAPTDSARQIERLRSQGMPQAASPASLVVPSRDASTGDESAADEAAAAAELKLEALFKTLQAYGL